MRVLSKFPSVFESPLPAFTADGALPPGEYAPSRIEFESRFVNAGDAVTRREIYVGFERHRAALLAAGLAPDACELLDGSYTEAKEQPGDIDLVVEVPVTAEELAAMTKDSPILGLLRGKITRKEYRCDAYAILALPPDHPDYYSVTVRGIEYWTELFGATREREPDRRRIPKGRVWTKIRGFHE
ncbi:MAG TPA: hypothetical protein VFP80_12375 [Thermoanaerobaculia bacterium]|nr:hypothetical protein [Thermoanaerobaculia bacterium]